MVATVCVKAFSGLEGLGRLADAARSLFPRVRTGNEVFLSCQIFTFV
jgi:hypothetical protein